jgi:hypothetical protein
MSLSEIPFHFSFFLFLSRLKWQGYWLSNYLYNESASFFPLLSVKSLIHCLQIFYYLGHQIEINGLSGAWTSLHQKKFVKKILEKSSLIHEAFRVTRLDEFLPFGWLFTLAMFYKSSANFWATFSMQLSISLAKQWVGLHFGRLFRKLIWSPWEFSAKTRTRFSNSLDEIIPERNWLIKTQFKPVLDPCT